MFLRNNNGPSPTGSHAVTQEEVDMNNGTIYIPFREPAAFIPYQYQEIWVSRQYMQRDQNRVDMGPLEAGTPNQMPVGSTEDLLLRYKETPRVR